MPGRSVKRLPSCLSRPRNSSIQRRTYSAKPLTSDALGPIIHDEQHHQSLRVLKDGNKLPLPPLLDPVVRLERSRWQQPKERPNVANFTPFQKKLWENPYGTLFNSHLITTRRVLHHITCCTHLYNRHNSLTPTQHTPSPPPSANAAQHSPSSPAHSSSPSTPVHTRQPRRPGSSPSPSPHQQPTSAPPTAS